MLRVKDLCVNYPFPGGGFGAATRRLPALTDISFELAAGETLGVVGESGCGKSTLARAMVRLLQPASGQILFAGKDLCLLSGSRLRAARCEIQMIFQDPDGSLNPRLTAGRIIGEALEIHRLAPTAQARQEQVAALLRSVGLDPSLAGRYPHEFSGGQRQRIGIARALAVHPRLIVCDESVSALDVSIQAQMVNLLRDFQAEHGVAYLFISHDLAVVEHLSHRILVMYSGRVVELGPARQVCGSPRHPYTQALLAAMPRMGFSEGCPRLRLPGEPPSPLHPPSGCPFHSRCPVAQPRCRTETPALREITSGHWAACHFPNSP